MNIICMEIFARGSRPGSCDIHVWRACCHFCVHVTTLGARWCRWACFHTAATSDSVLCNLSTLLSSLCNCWPSVPGEVYTLTATRVICDHRFASNFAPWAPGQSVSPTLRWSIVDHTSAVTARQTSVVHSQQLCWYLYLWSCHNHIVLCPPYWARAAESNYGCYFVAFIFTSHILFLVVQPAEVCLCTHKDMFLVVRPGNQCLCTCRECFLW